MAVRRSSIIDYLLLGVILFTLSLTVFFSQQQQKTQQHAAVNNSNVTVDYTLVLRKLDPIAIGMDISGYQTPNVFANDVVEQQKLKALAIKYMRMDLKYAITGDPTSQIQCGGNGCMTSLTGDQWINAIKGVGAEPVVIVPTTSSVDAANLVKHFNKDTNNPVHYWIVGNEPDINGYSAQSYSNYFNQDYDAMKAIDPNIKVGGGTTAWYDSSFLQTFLQLSGSRVDFVDFHGYPQQGTTPGNYTTLFNWATGTGNDVGNLMALIQSTVPARASQIGIEMGEWELNWGGSAQDYINFHSVWVADVLGNILQAGGKSMFFADKGNAIFMNAHTLTDSLGRTYTVSPDDTNPAYHGIGMFTGEGLFQGFGNTMVKTTTTLPNVDVFASDNPKNIVVINKDPSISQTAVISLNGVSSGSFDVWRKDEQVSPPSPPGKLGTVAIQNGTVTYQLPPFSVTTFVLTGSTGGSSPTISQPSLNPSITSNPTSTASTTFFLTLCPHGLGNCGDNVNPNSSGNLNPIHQQRAVTLTFLNAQNQQIGTAQGIVSYNSSAGNFQGSINGNISSGQYLVRVFTNGFIPKQVSGIITITQGQQITIPEVSLVNGDINNDGQLDILDYNILVGCFGSKQSSSSCTVPTTTQVAGADIDDDGIIDGADYNLFLREFNLQNDPGGTSPTSQPTSVPNTTTPTSPPSSSKSILGVNNSGAVKTYLPAFQSVGISSVRIFALYQSNLKGYLASLAAAQIRPLLVLDEATIVNGSLQYCHANKHQTVNTDQQIVQALLDTYGSGYDGWFEFGNEPNTSPGNCGYTATQYTAGWNAVIPQLKAMAPNAKFGGPVLPNTDTSYVTTFLQQANPKPDFVSWHLYAGNYNWNTNQLQSQWQGWGNQIGSVNNTVMSVIGNSVPLLITEWNYAWDGGVGNDSRVTPLSTSTFAQNFASQVLAEFQTAGITASYLFVDPSFPSPVGTTSSDPSYGQLTFMGTAFSAAK